MSKDTHTKRDKGNVLSFHPSGEYYFDKGVEAYDRQDLQNAEKYLQRGVQLEPDEPLISFQLAVIYTELGKYEQSNKLLRDIMAHLDEALADCYYLLANNYAYMGLFEDAYHFANHYLEMPNDGTFKKDTEDLLELLSYEVDEDFADEDSSMMGQENAEELLATGAFPEVIVLLDELIEEYPRYWPAYNNLALAYFYTRKIEKSAAMIDFVLQEDEGNLHALCNKLIMLHAEGYAEEADEVALMLEKVKPMLAEHQFKLGTTFVLVGRYEQAYELLRTLQKYGFEEDDSFYYWLSYAAYFTDRTEVAHSIWKKVIMLQPEKIGKEPWNEFAPQVFAPLEHINPPKLER